MNKTCLTAEMLRKALKFDICPPDDKPCVVLNPVAWENFKKAFTLTEAQMEKWFVKATYIKDRG